ncbi:hypothetical protein DMB66_23190 [Actinoplanes sp. ATCC 53533]|uniref:TldD/PmbA family protein n=1 Tax=Actinoplanes sp. ATCC 53533 TaxID=1288362 RepID=UPI000F7AED62|nr:metallopeptidase TldD-related protein [Actinoplanes sp. ATCC 53533]RSM61971.1 hypothetical protein DMB66_23190 [Actinoplanes sp. ATCC 53533]
MTLADDIEAGAGQVLEIARRALANCRPVADYAQVFAEFSLQARWECRDGEAIATGLEPLAGLGCLIREAGGRWRRRAFSSREVPALSQWCGAPDDRPSLEWTEMPTTIGFLPLAPEDWLPIATDRACSVRSVEDFVLRTAAVVDTDGAHSSQTTRTLRHRVETTMTVGGRGYRGLSRRFRREQVDVSLAESRELVRVAQARAHATASAAVRGRRRTPVVFGPSAGAGFLHELIGHALEGDNFSLGSTYLANLCRPNAVPALLTMRDDPTVPHGFGSFDFDDEGMVARATTLVENGEIGTPLTSFRVARRNGYTRTPNGRRQDFRELAIPRASNTVVLPGPEDPARLLEDSTEGVLHVGSLGAGMINLVTGVFTFAAIDCTFIGPDGSRSPVRDVSLTGDAVRILGRIEGIGTDFGGDNITCGKQGQLVGIGIYSPSIRFAALDWLSA